MFRLACLAIGYVFGCFQTAYILTRRKTSQDIRDLGSGNAGAANAYESVGKGAAALTLLGDGTKTAAAIGLCLWIFNHFPLVEFAPAADFNTHSWHLGGYEEQRMFLTVYAGVGTALGHNFPFWLRFRGGKGVAVTLMTLLILDWKVVAILAVSAILVYGSSRRLIMGTMTLAFVTPFLLWALRYPPELVFLMAGMSLVMFYLHRKDLRDPKKIIKEMEERGELLRPVEAAKVPETKNG